MEARKKNHEENGELLFILTGMASFVFCSILTSCLCFYTQHKRVFSWGTWGCGVSKFPWTYDSNESCYLLEGQVTVTPSDGSPPATFGKGDFVTFPAGMSCTWDVSEPVQKHFMFF